MKSARSTKRMREEKEEASKNMIDVKDAARIAADYFASLYAEEEYSDVQLVWCPESSINKSCPAHR